MPRSFTPRGLRALQAQTEGAALLSLVTITYPGSIFRVVNNSVAITSRGAVFQPYAFSFTRPEDSLSTQPQVEFAIDNVDLVLVDMLRAAVTPPAVKIEMIVSDTPDTVELVVDGLLLRHVKWNAGTITGTLAADDFFSQAFPSRHPFYDPAQFPGIFS